jgi:glutamine synthetase
MTEVMNADGTPHASNGRATIDDDGDFWFGFEQEYFIMDTKTLLPLGFLLVVILLHKECTTVQ